MYRAFMVTESEKSLIRETLARLEAGTPGFRRRRGQLEMIGAIARVFASAADRDTELPHRGDGIICVEGGTGLGKSLAYLVAGAVLAKSRGKRLVISSSTVALQHQLVEKDLPALRKALPVPIIFCTAKGRGRFVCVAKLQDRATAAEQTAMDLDTRAGRQYNEIAAEDRARELGRELARLMASGAWDGDRDNLKIPVPENLWAELTTDRQGCAGKHCPCFEECPYYAARRQIRESDVIVASHSLTLASLAMEVGSVLPDPEECFFVFDEAHALPAKAIEQFAERHTVLGAADWIARLGETVPSTALALSLGNADLQPVIAQCDGLRRCLLELHRVIEQTHAFDEQTTRRFKRGLLPDWARTLGDNLFALACGLQEGLATLRERMLERAPHHAALVQRLLSGLGFYIGKLDALVATWALMLAEDAGTGHPTARWIERYEAADGRRDFAICASPIVAGDKLCRLLFRRAAGVALSSATLTSCGSFDAFLQHTGLDRLPQTQVLRLTSPFDYPRQGRLVVPRMRSSAKDAASHTREVGAILPGLLQSRGTLVLFASGAQMRAVAASLPPQIRPRVLVQGDGPKMNIVARHKDAIDRGDSSVIFGLSSFAEGVDLPGEYCTHVIISKLAFAQPGTPFEEARREWIESQGKSAFAEISVPETAIRLAQAVGRLLRTVDDHGTVTCLDRRLSDTTWGRRILRGLPPFRLDIEPRGGRRHSPEQTTTARTQPPPSAPDTATGEAGAAA